MLRQVPGIPGLSGSEIWQGAGNLPDVLQAITWEALLYLDTGCRCMLYGLPRLRDLAKFVDYTNVDQAPIKRFRKQKWLQAMFPIIYFRKVFIARP